VSNPSLELASRMPWLHAEGGSLWIASGAYKGGGTFTDCLLRAVPEFITGTDYPVFEILLYAQTEVVSASAITTARELLFVYADDPGTALYSEDQDFLDRSFRLHGGESK